MVAGLDESEYHELTSGAMIAPGGMHDTIIQTTPGAFSPRRSESS